MNKTKKEKLIITIITVILLIFPIVFGYCYLYAEDFDCINNYEIEINLDDKGDMDIKEVVEVNASTQYYQYEHTIITSKNNNYLKSLIVPESLSYYVMDENKKILNDFDANIYEVEIDKESISSNSNSVDECKFKGYNLFINSKSNKISASKLYYVVEYKIKDAVTTYNDTSELDWTFYSGYSGKIIKNITVKINYPSVNNEDIVILKKENITNQLVNNNQLTINIDKLNRLEPINTHILFPNDAIVSSDQKNNNHLNYIVNKDKEREAKIKNYSYIDNYGTIVFGVFVIFSIIFMIYFYLKYERENKNHFINEYFREPVNDYGPAIMNYLVNSKRIDIHAFEAVIVDLINRKYISISYEGKSTLDENPNYILTLNNPNYQSLISYEVLTLDFLFKKVSKDKNTLTLYELKNSINLKSVGYSDFIEYFKGNIIKESNKYNLFDEQVENKCFIYALINGIFGLIAFLSAISLGIFVAPKLLIMQIITIIIAIYGVYYFVSIKKRSEKGDEDYYKWMAFKKYLIEFFTIKDYSLPSVAIMEEYLSYAVALNVSTLANKQIDLSIKENYKELKEISDNVNFLSSFRINNKKMVKMFKYTKAHKDK